MSFEKKFTDEDVLSIISNQPKTTAVIMSKLGCHRNTANGYLRRLEKKGKIKKIQIEGSTTHAWVRRDLIMLSEELHEKVKGLTDDEFIQIRDSLYENYGKDNVMLARLYPMKVSNVQGILIKRDVRSMKVVDKDIFQEVYSVWMEQGCDGEVAFKYLLSNLNLWGYRLDRGLIMLKVVDTEVDENEIRFNCEYPINMSCRIDPNNHGDVFLSDDTVWDERFSITIENNPNECNPVKLAIMSNEC